MAVKIPKTHVIINLHNGTQYQGTLEASDEKAIRLDVQLKIDNGVRDMGIDNLLLDGGAVKVVLNKAFIVSVQYTEERQ